MRVSLSKLPDPAKEYSLALPRLDGGLNLYELDYRMDADESPEMKNLLWLDGALGSRDGQVWASPDGSLGEGFACHDSLFWDYAIFHIGDGLYCSKIAEDAEFEITPTLLCGGVPENRGTFFHFRDSIFYKNGGGYFQIRYDGENDTLSAAPVVPYSPIIYINMNPTTASGDAYQPENRICAEKTVWYSAVADVKEYKLPITNVDAVTKVIVDGEELAEGTGYTVDLAAGKVIFAEAPAVPEPFDPNTVQITYAEENLAAYNSVMECPYAVVFGGNQNVCVVVGGCHAQPNAYFWSGNHIAMDAGYFPMEQYNLAGDTEESITGFGKQQAMLVIFKERSIGRASFDTVEMESGRQLIEMPYTNINAKIGCDLPWSIQLIENNLVFGNTKNGIHILKDSSSAYENNIAVISTKVNGTPERSGLLDRVRRVRNAFSYDDGDRYWFIVNGDVYLWDYHLSEYGDPSWFYFTNINAVSFFDTADDTYHMNAAGRITRFERQFADYDEPIEKIYRFAAQTFGGFDRKKNVRSILLQVRSDTDTLIDITYLTDYEERHDTTPVVSYSWRINPRNLAYRFLGIPRFSTVVRRKPACRNVRHFSMRLTNNEVGNDMSVVSAQIFYTYQGRER